MRSPGVKLGLVAVGVITLIIGFIVGRSTPANVGAEVIAQEMMDVYYPGTETLGADEFRVTACGTGQPSVRPKQAAACWLVELGNGDKFLFDIGAQSMSRISAMKIPMDYLDKVFIGHLHVDHMGDLPILWTGGQKMNRTVPLRVWGPSGTTPEMGTRAAIEGLKQFMLWDDVSLAGRLDVRATEWVVNEFDYKGVNQVIYQENGVTIRSIPAIHAIDGAVSFILEWNGFKFAYSSDTFPNQWWMEHAVGADLAVHECFAPPEVLIEKQNYEPTFALWLSTLGHLSGPVRQDHGDDRAAHGGRVPLLQRFRHTANRSRAGPVHLRRPDDARDRLHGLQRHAGRRSRAHGGCGPRHLALASDEGKGRRPEPGTNLWRVHEVG